VVAIAMGLAIYRHAILSGVLAAYLARKEGMHDKTTSKKT
jgi:hypothetical protein